MSSPEIESTELSPVMAELTPRERNFVANLFVPGMSAAAAAQKAGYGTADSKGATFASIAHRLKTRPHIGRAITEMCQAQVKALGPSAIAGAREIIADKKHKDRGKMIRHILDRLDPATMLHAHMHQHDVTVKVEDHTTAVLKSLKWMRELGVPHEKLLEHFGFSGLARYQKMLDEQERREPKLIESSPVVPSSVTAVGHHIADDNEADEDTLA
jgi:phage terminase small subunit